MRRRFVQGGSVKVFVIVGIILMALALTALYFVGKNFTSDQVPPMVVPESTSEDIQSADDADDSDPAKTDDEESTPSPQSDDGQQSGDSSDPSASGGTSGETPPAQGQSGVSTESATNGPSLPSTGGAPVDLPRTGPTDDLLSTLGAAAIVFSVVSYVASVRSLRA